MNAPPSPTSPPDVVVLGGGAAGFFAAIAAAEGGARVRLLERGARVLTKVLISGGGRCNVTNAEEKPEKLVRNYPRGGTELRGPFTKFGPRDTRRWFESRGVALKTEEDGRVFPVTDRSQTIVDALTAAAQGANVEVRTGAAVRAIRPDGTGFQLDLNSGESLSAARVLLATGSNPQGHAWARALGHTIVPPVPSLFTFTIKDPRLKGLAGVASPRARVKLEGTSLEQAGPVLITHWGLSGPAVLRLSAWGARVMHEAGYRATLRVNWLDQSPEVLQKTFDQKRKTDPRKSLSASPFDIPQRLWDSLRTAAGLPAERRWADLSKPEMARLGAELGDGAYAVTGKSAFKDEFVTSGGVALEEVDFRTMESRRRPGLYFAGEILDIDGVTGGFNFQNAWTTGWLAGRALARP